VAALCRSLWKQVTYFGDFKVTVTLLYSDLIRQVSLCPITTLLPCDVLLHLLETGDTELTVVVELFQDCFFYANLQHTSNPLLKMSIAKVKIYNAAITTDWVWAFGCSIYTISQC